MIIRRIINDNYYLKSQIFAFSIIRKQKLNRVEMGTLPQHLRDLLKDLEYLGMLKENCKPNWHDYTFSSTDSYKDAFYRMIYGESKKDSVERINSIVQKTASALQENRETEYFDMLYSSFEKAKIGIENLKLTYSESPDFLADINVTLADIAHQLAKFSPTKFKKQTTGHIASLGSGKS